MFFSECMKQKTGTSNILKSMVILNLFGSKIFLLAKLGLTNKNCLYNTKLGI